MDKDTVKSILAKYSPPLTPSQMDQIGDAVVTKHHKALKKVKTISIESVLAKYSPPLSPGQMDEIAEAFLHAVRSKRPKRARRKTKKSKKVAETPSPENTAEKPEAESTSKGESQSLNVAGSK